MSRPRGAQIAATVSGQSSVVASRQELEQAFEALDSDASATLPRPERWGGFRLRPEVIEFWHGRLHRLHDRVRYTRVGDGWMTERLAP